MGVCGQDHALSTLPLRRDTVPIVQEDGWAWKLLPPSGFNPQAVWHVVGHYTNYMNQAHM
jgi:hypothetical protein